MKLNKIGPILLNALKNKDEKKIDAFLEEGEVKPIVRNCKHDLER